MALVGQPLLILLFGPRFAGSFVPCLLVLLGCSALCFSGPLAGTVAGAGAYPRSIIVAQGVALLVNVGVNIVLIPRYGATGAAAASTVAYIVSAAILARAFAARFSVPMHELLRPESPLALIRRLRSH
jgi:O-antigen/teichoic acid export membrane protein